MLIKEKEYLKCNYFIMGKLRYQAQINEFFMCEIIKKKYFKVEKTILNREKLKF